MHARKSEIKIDNKTISLNDPVYFIADIAANHDGDLSRARDLIYIAAEAGADAAKFQHFKAETIVSDYGFRNMPKELQSHQSSWEKSVFEVYGEASLNPDWTEILKETCVKAGIEFMTSPYSVELVDEVDPFVPAYKIGSGDITYFGVLEHIAKKGKPVILATGASIMSEVKDAVELIEKYNDNIILMQCNTNYTASLENFKYLKLRVLETYKKEFPGMILGISDHTPGHSSILGAVALGARVVEKHFTDDIHRIGPDHKFSMTPSTWKEMVKNCRELELALGDGIKRVEGNEKTTVVVQRRAVRAAKNLKKGEVLGSEHLISLRPCPPDGIPPCRINEILGKKLSRDLKEGEHITEASLSHNAVLA